MPLISWFCVFVIFYRNIDYFTNSKQIGPNVSISANARIGAGARLVSCIILDDVEIKVCDWITYMAFNDWHRVLHFFFILFCRKMQLLFMQLLGGNLL